MTDAQTAAFAEALREHLDEGMTSLREAVNGLTVEQLDARLGPDTNSISVIVMHTVSTARSICHDLADDPVATDRKAAFEVSGLSADDLRQTIDEWVIEQAPLLARAFAAPPGRQLQRYRLASQTWWLLQLAGHAREHAAQAHLTRQSILAAAGAVAAD
jgi:hypothetical protein